MHLDLDNAIAGTVFAATTLDVKAEATGAVAAQFCFWHSSKQLADWRKQPGVCCWVTSRCTAYRGLIDDNYFVDVRHSLDTVMLPDWEDAFIEIIEKVLGEGVDDEGRLPRS